MDFGYADRRIGRDGLDVLGFDPEVQFFQQVLGEPVGKGEYTEALGPLRAFFEGPGQAVHDVQVALDDCLDAWPLHLHDRVRAVDQLRPVDLRDGRAGQGSRVDLGEDLVRRA